MREPRKLENVSNLLADCHNDIQCTLSRIDLIYKHLKEHDAENKDREIRNCIGMIEGLVKHIENSSLVTRQLIFTGHEKVADINVKYRELEN